MRQTAASVSMALQRYGIKRDFIMVNCIKQVGLGKDPFGNKSSQSTCLSYVERPLLIRRPQQPFHCAAMVDGWE